MCYQAFPEKITSSSIIGAAKLGLESRVETRKGVAELGWRKRDYGYRDVQEGLLRLKQVGYWDEGI